MLDSLETSPSDSSPSFFRLGGLGFGEGVFTDEDDEDEEDDEEEEEDLDRRLFLSEDCGGGVWGGGDPDMTELLLSLIGEYNGR